MKYRHLCACIIWLYVGAQAITAGEPAPPIVLNGILSIGSKQIALLEADVQPKRAGSVPDEPRLPTRRSHLMLSPGEGQDNIELLSIDALGGRVQVRKSGEIIELGFPANAASGTLVTRSSRPNAGPAEEEVPFLRLNRLSINDFLILYQVLTHRSLIRPASLPAAVVDGLYATGPVTAADVVTAMEQVLKRKGMVMQPDGEKFAVLAASESHMEEINARLRDARELAATIGKSLGISPASAQSVKASTAVSAEAAAQEIPAGAINIPNTMMLDVFPVYAHLSYRTLIQTASFASPNISFTSQTPLTLVEAIYALSAVFAVNGISFAAAGEKFLLVFPNMQKDKVAPLLFRKGPVDYPGLTNTIPAGSINFPNTTFEAFTELYGKLSGRSVEVGADVPRPNLRLVSETPLTAGEALQALDLLFGLNGLEAVHAPGGAGLRIVRRTD